MLQILKKLWQASRFSMQGLGAAINEQFAIRLEIFLGAIFIPLAFYVGQTPLQIAVLIFSLLLVFIVELINSAIETVVDRIGLEQHVLSGRAKDLGSAAVFIACVNVICVWGIILCGYLGYI